MTGARRVIGVGVVLLVAGVVALVASGPGAAQYGPSASSTLIALVIADTTDSLGVDGFAGTYGAAGTPDTDLPADADPGDLSDPDGVLEHATVAGAPTARTGWAAVTDQLTGQAQFVGVTFAWAGAAEFLAIGSIDAYASCAPPSPPTAYLRVDSGQIRVLGTGAGPGTSTLDVTGDQVGLSTFATGTLTVTVTVVEETTPTSAQARLAVEITGSFQDAAGNTGYEGPVLGLVAGDVSVDCATSPAYPSPPATPTPTASPAPSPSPSPSPSPTPTPTPTPAPTPTPTPSPSPTPSPTATPTPTPSGSPSPEPSGSPSPTPSGSPSPTPSGSPSPEPSGSPSPGPTAPPGPGPSPGPVPPPPVDGGPGLPPTGLPLPAWWGVLSVLAGAALVLAGSWRSRVRATGRYHG